MNDDPSGLVCCTKAPLTTWLLNKVSSQCCVWWALWHNKACCKYHCQHFWVSASCEWLLSCCGCLQLQITNAVTYLFCLFAAFLSNRWILIRFHYYWGLTAELFFRRPGQRWKESKESTGSSLKIIRNLITNRSNTIAMWNTLWIFAK